MHLFTKLRYAREYGSLCVALLVATSEFAAAAPKMGVFTSVSGGSSGTRLQQYEGWLNRRMDYFIQFIPYRRFTGSDPSLVNTNYWFNDIQNFPQDQKDRMVLTVGMLPSTSEGNTTLALGASGTYDEHWRALADRLIANGLGNNIIRLGHENNGNWYRWNSIGKTTHFRNYWIRIVTAMRKLPDGTPRPGANFKFCWNPVPGDPNGHGNPLAAYPGTGNQYVDYVGLDAYDTSVTYYSTAWGNLTSSYDTHFETLAQTGTGTLTASQIQSCRSSAWSSLQSWGNYDLDWWTAQLNDSTSVIYNMPLCFPEWGIDNIMAPGEWGDGSGGRDNTYFLRKMYEWFSNPVNKVDWIAYFDSGLGDGSSERNHAIFQSNQYPLAKAYFPTKFGSMIHDDFEDGNPTGWTLTPLARWSVVTDAGDKALKFDYDTSNTSGRAEIGSTTWTDASIITDFKITALPGWCETRLWVRYTDASNNYMVKLQDQGGVRKLLLYKTVGGVVTQLGSSATVTVNANTWYTLELAASGTNVSVKFNGATKIAVVDTTFATGKVALGGYKEDVLFDNVLVIP